MKEMTFDDFVDGYAAKLDSEPSSEGFSASPDGSFGSRFKSIMNAVNAQAGAIPWFKLAVVAAVVIQGIRDGKTVSEIIQEALAALVG